MKRKYFGITDCTQTVVFGNPAVLRAEFVHTIFFTSTSKVKSVDAVKNKAKEKVQK